MLVRARGSGHCRAGEKGSGAPVALVGTSQPAACLRPSEQGLHVVRLLGMQPDTRELPRDGFLALPTRQPEMGEWCLVFGNGPLLTKWHGVRGFCGPRVHYCPEAAERQGSWHAVTFEFAAFLGSVNTVPLPLKQLAALPLPPPGSEHAPLEAPVAPRQVLPALRESEARMLSEAGLPSSSRGAQRLVVEQRQPTMQDMQAAEAPVRDPRLELVTCQNINGVIWHNRAVEDVQSSEAGARGSAEAATAPLENDLPQASRPQADPPALPLEAAAPKKYRRLRPVT